MAPSTRTLLAVALLAGSAQAGAADSCIDASESGQVERDRGHFQAAKKLLQTCAREACPGEIRKDCAGWLDALEKRIPSISVRVVDASGREVLDATVTIDGAPIAPGGIAVPLDPGEKVIKITRQGGSTVEQTIRVVEGERARVVEVKLEEPKKAPATSAASPPPPPPSTSHVPVATYALGGVAALAAGGYLYFGLHAKSEVDDMRATCAPGCEATRVDAAKRDRDIANVLFGVSLLSVGGAVYFAISDRPTQALARSPRLTVTATPAFSGALLTSRF